MLATLPFVRLASERDFRPSGHEREDRDVLPFLLGLYGWYADVHVRITASTFRCELRDTTNVDCGVNPPRTDLRNDFNAADLPRWQRPLLASAWLCIAALLLTPLVVTLETAYPFTVGKAVYARTLVAISVALWVPLALANARFRPPRSWLLVLWGAAFAIALMAALAITVLAVNFAAGPTHAQGGDTHSNSIYQAPMPCGDGLADVPDNPVNTISSGHVDLLDAYWDFDSQPLNNNQCPPTVTPAVTGFGTNRRIESITRAASNADVGWTVIRVKDDYQVVVVDGVQGQGPEAYPGVSHIDREEYPFLKKLG